MESRNRNSKWVLGECIGKGSYGTVNVGIRESDGSVFAVKSAVKDSLSSIEALENEIRVLRSLSSSSPFIVEYYGDDETGSHRCLHMEYVTGGDVRKAAGVDDVELIRSYTWCLVMALRTVHSQGIVHCDVKGSNVLVGPKGVAKLADFGSAMRIHHQRGKIVPRGSPLWMAPEVVRGESQTLESDIWSLGCTVIEMFTGMPAWQDCGPHTLYQIGQSNDLPEYPARLPDLGRDFLNKCLARDPQLRWSCDQLLQHPFLLPVPSLKITESSPRSIFDYQTLEFSDDDDHESEYDSMEISARDRIRELETTSLANWDCESDDWNWIEVRTMENRVEEKEEGTNWENQELTDDKRVNSQRETNNDDATWNNNGGGDRCGHGGGDAVVDVVVGNINIRINCCGEDLRVTAVPIDALFLGQLFFIFCCIVVIILPQVWDMNNKYIQKFQKLFYNFGSDSYIEKHVLFNYYCW